MKISRKNKTKIQNAMIVFCILFFIFSCSRNRNEVIGAVENRQLIPRAHGIDIITLISDSGVTRYRITAPVWSVFDRADPPFQEFPEGIHLERFDVNLFVDVNIRSDYAKFLEREERWFLRGNVDATNLAGERFETERLFWDQRAEKIYSDTLVRITDPTGVIMYGDSFVSDQMLANSVVTNARGDITITEEE
jgi:LPS export ABC transporter protein LptC